MFAQKNVNQEAQNKNNQDNQRDLKIFFIAGHLIFILS